MKQFYEGLKLEPYPGLYVTNYQDSKDLLDLVSGVFSPLSTMLVESILNGKPCLVLFPDVIKDKVKHNQTNLLKELVYFKEFIDRELILTSDNSDDLIDKTIQLIKFSKDLNIKKRLIKHSKNFVNFPKPNYQINILKLCNTMLKT